MERFLSCFLLFVVLLTFTGSVGAEMPSGEIGSDFESELRNELKSPPMTRPGPRPVSSRQWDSKTRILLARSCVGEAKFDAVEECMAIAWCYAKRAKKVKWSLYKMIKRYSAAVKPHERHRRPWLFELNANATHPPSWPTKLSWKKHRPYWRKLLAAIDLWQAGYVPDPQPDANHFGSKADAMRAYYVRRWKRLDTPRYLNWFFDSTQKINVNISRQRIIGNLGRNRASL